MTITAQTGAFGMGGQAAKGTAALDANMNWYRVLDTDFGPVVDERPFPPEVGQVIVPTGAYRAGAYAAGSITFLPRLLDEFGWLLDWVLGENSTAVGQSSNTWYKHTWTLDGSEDSLNWATVKVIVPGSADLGVVAMDTKASSLRLVLPQNGLVSASMDMVSRLFDDETSDDIFDESPTGGGWPGSFEDFDTVPVSTKGAFTVAGLDSGNELPVTGVALDFINGTTTPAQEMIIGKFSPDDFVPVARTVSVRATYKWPNADLYQTIVAGSTTGTKWLDDVFTGQAVVQVQTGKDIPGSSPLVPYELKITLPNVVWQVSNPRLAGSNIVAVDLIGTAIKLDGANFMVLDLHNDISAAYAWPS